MLSMTNVQHELVSDASMNLFFEKGIRARVSYISKRYSKTNNKYLQCCISKEESKNIIESDDNNLYGYYMVLHSNREV